MKLKKFVIKIVHGEPIFLTRNNYGSCKSSVLVVPPFRSYETHEDCLLTLDLLFHCVIIATAAARGSKDKSQHVSLVFIPSNLCM